MYDHLKSMFHPLMRVWIEITVDTELDIVGLFHPLMRVWIELGTGCGDCNHDVVSPSYEGVD